MHGIYDKHGLRFQYPSGWTVDDDQTDAADVAVTASSPQTAFWTVMLYDDGHDVQQLADCVLEALQSEYPQLEFDAIDYDDELFAGVGQERAGYDLSFTYLDLNNFATIRAFQHGAATYLVLAQAEDHEVEEVEPLFEAMTASLLAHPQDLDDLN